MRASMCPSMHGWDRWENLSRSVSRSSIHNGSWWPYQPPIWLSCQAGKQQRERVKRISVKCDSALQPDLLFTSCVYRRPTGLSSWNRSTAQTHKIWMMWGKRNTALINPLMLFHTFFFCFFANFEVLSKSRIYFVVFVVGWLKVDRLQRVFAEKQYCGISKDDYFSSNINGSQSFCALTKMPTCALPLNPTQPRRPFKTGTFLNPLYTLPLQISWPPASTYFPLPVFSVCLNPLPPNTPTPSEAWVHCSDVLKVESAIAVVVWELPGTGRLSRGLHHKAFWSCQRGLNTVFTAVTHACTHTHTQYHSIVCICVCMRVPEKFTF